jgi:hypothetical protein
VRVRLVLLLLSASAVLPAAAGAAGGHDRVGCAGCHATHAARGERLAALAPNLQAPERRTGRPHGPATALCLSCHADADEGGKGIAPVSGHLFHPFSVATVNARVAQVPPEWLRGGRFECLSCHDPHPSNPNWRYLRVAVAGPAELPRVCEVCHPRKAAAAAAAAAPPRRFSSMDERDPAAAGR